MLSHPQSRSAPQSFARSDRSGIYVPVPATLAGRARWQVLDERGVPEIPRNPSGFAIGPVEGVENPNLITDAGMDAIATQRAATNAATGIRHYLAIGTGSTAPDVTDTTLDSEVQRTASAGTFSVGGTTTGYEGSGASRICYAEYRTTRAPTMTADRNLTEYGFSHLSAAGGALNIRELFRDELGDPVTISLLNGKTLKLDHTLRMELPASPDGYVSTFDFDRYDATNVYTGTDSYDVIAGLCIRNDPASISALFAGHWEPSDALTGFFEGAGYYNTSPFAWARGFVNIASGRSPAKLAVQTYTAGTYEREKSGTIAAGNEVATWNGIIFVSDVGNEYAYLHVLFTDPTTFVKTSTETVQLALVSSWARA